MPALFVAGTGTDVGKTHVAGALLRALRAQGRKVDVLKPVVSGFDPAAPQSSDPALLIAACGRELSAAEIERVSPFRYRAPLAPPQAARREGRTLDLAQLVDLCGVRIAEAGDTLLLIEGAGGVMSPIAQDATGLDLMAALRLPSLLVTGAYLGAISHALTAVESLRVRDMAPEVIVVSERDADGPSLAETRAAIECFSHVRTCALERNSLAGIAELAAGLRV